MCSSWYENIQFIKENEASRLLISSGIKITLSKIPLVYPLLF